MRSAHARARHLLSSSAPTYIWRSGTAHGADVRRTQHAPVPLRWQHAWRLCGGTPSIARLLCKQNCWHGGGCTRRHCLQHGHCCGTRGITRRFAEPLPARAAPLPPSATCNRLQRLPATLSCAAAPPRRRGDGSRHLLFSILWAYGRRSAAAAPLGCLHFTRNAGLCRCRAASQPRTAWHLITPLLRRCRGYRGKGL